MLLNLLNPHENSRESGCATRATHSIRDPQSYVSGTDTGDVSDPYFFLSWGKKMLLLLHE